jgi:hypothetical protein
LIFRKDLSETTGYTGYFLNATKTRTDGAELTLTGSVLRNPNALNWDVTANWSTYTERYIELPPGQTTIFTFFQKGDRVDKVYGNAFVRTPDGQIINDAGGRPLRYPVNQFLGNGGPDWIWGLNNKFNWKGLSLGFQFDGRVGGVLVNYVRQQTFRGGRHIETVQGKIGEARLQDVKGIKSYVGEGVQVSNGAAIQYDPVTGLVTNYKGLEFAPNTTQTFVQDYISRYNNTNEGNLMSKTYVKLREVILGYSLPQNILGSSFIKRADISLVARNVLYWLRDKRNKDIDVDQYAGDQGFGNLQSPTTRRYGINLNIVF